MPERTIETVSVHQLIKGSGALWKEATRSPFPDAIDSGHLPDEAFNRWLVQDYKFGLGLVSFQSFCLAGRIEQAKRSMPYGKLLQAD